MKVNRIYSNNPTKKYIQFQGITQRMPQLAINSADDLAKQYRYLRSARYYEALDDDIYPQNRFIRMENFSFLERIPQFLKRIFVEKFKEFTSFPNIAKVSEKINDTFVSNAIKAENSDVRVMLAGYDPVCSIGLKRALPGSDIDKAYIILGKKQNVFKDDDRIIADYKGTLWDNVDQRILSLNNQNTFPEVYTLDKMFNTLDILDRLTVKYGLHKDMDYFKQKRMFDIDPVSAGEFNIRFAKMNNGNDISKVYAKNFAYFIESVRDGKIAYKVDDDILNVIRERLNRSPFAIMSNVTQMGAHERQISTGMKDIKKKLRAREHLVDEFASWKEDDQFNLVKNIVKAVSKDQDNTFDRYFMNDDDILERYERLNRQLI